MNVREDIVEIKEHCRQQAGFTLIEVLVAALILAVGLGAAIGIVNTASHANETALRHENAIKIAQREMEDLDDLSYEQLALTSTPVNSSDANNPLNRVNGSQFTPDTGQAETMAVGGDTAAVDPGPTTVDEGGVVSEAYRFVTYVDGPSYDGCTQNCDTTQDYKRVTVAVKTASSLSGGFSKYVMTSTLRVDPLLGPEGEITQPEDPNPAQAHNNFYLYDTPLSTCANVSYQQPSGNHAVHDTRGFCGSGSGDYPDLMGLGAPPNPYDPDPAPLFTYSSDLAGMYEGGIAIQRQSDCLLADLTKYQLHAWETNPVSTADYAMTGKAAVDLWTATVGGVSAAGKVCAWLYDRNMVGGNPQDTLIKASSYELSSWPTTPTNLSFTFSYPEYVLPAGHRLHLVLSVSSDSGADIQIVYDHPESSSFLQVGTTTPTSQ